MGVLKSVEPTGFLAFAPAFAGTNWADVNRRIIQNCSLRRAGDKVEIESDDHFGHDPCEDVEPSRVGKSANGSWRLSII